jgi:tetratricopeptide (TPR) repeat protein
MIDYEILSHLERIDDLEKASLALKEIRRMETPSFEEAQIITNLLIPFWKSEDVTIKTLANEAYNHLRTFYRDLDMPKEMLDSNVGLRKLKKDFEDFEKKRTREVPVFVMPEAVPPKAETGPGKPDHANTVSLEKQFFFKGSKAIEEEDWEEAEKQFNRLLDICSEHAQGLLGKGVAIGRQENAADRMPEVLECFDKALKNGLHDPLEKMSAAKHLNSIAVSVFRIALKAWEEEKQTKGEGPAGLLDKAMIALDALVLTSRIHNSPEVMKNIHFCAHMLAELEALPAAKRETYRAMQSAHEAELKKIDPNFGQVKKACFVATAAMGSSLHPDVGLLREFRDVRLMSTDWGRFLIRCYNRLGPRLARVIADCPRLRLGVRVLVIRPLAATARGLMRKP